MGFFNLFKPAPKIQDSTFGELKFFGSKNPSERLFEGQAVAFRPLQRLIGITIEADESGPTESQRRFFGSLEERYDQFKLSLIPLLNKELTDWYAGRLIEDFDQEFELESILIPRIDSEPVKWSITYVAKKIKHWANIEVIGLDPVHIHIDG